MSKNSDAHDRLDEHPEDVELRKEGEEYARQHGAEFVAEFSTRLAEVITTYGDAAAEDIMWELREQFWGRFWKPRKP